MRRGYALVRKQPLKIFCSLAIKTKSNRGPYRSIKKIDTHRSVHAKGDIEAFIGKRVAHFFVRLAAFGFVEDDKLNIRYVGQDLTREKDGPVDRNRRENQERRHPIR